MILKFTNKKRIKNNRGTALLMTLLILSSILVVALATASLVMSGIKISRNQIQSAKAFFAAEAGAEKSLWAVRKDSYVLADTDQDNVFNGTLDNDSVYQVDYATTTPTVTFTSTGSYQQVKRSVTVGFAVN